MEIEKKQQLFLIDKTMNSYLFIKSSEGITCEEILQRYSNSIPPKVFREFMNWVYNSSEDNIVLMVSDSSPSKTILYEQNLLNLFFFKYPYIEKNKIYDLYFIKGDLLIEFLRFFLLKSPFAYKDEKNLYLRCFFDILDKDLKFFSDLLTGIVPFRYYFNQQFLNYMDNLVLTSIKLNTIGYSKLIKDISICPNFIKNSFLGNHLGYFYKNYPIGDIIDYFYRNLDEDKKIKHISDIGIILKYKLDLSETKGISVEFFAGGKFSWLDEEVSPCFGFIFNLWWDF